MQGYDPSTYGERIATVYDRLHTWLGDVEPVVSTLAELCRGGRALELGIGTGRVALPLAARGTEVHGIDASQAMVTQMRAKEGGESIPVTVGDFADVNVEGTFSTIFVCFNTFFALYAQEDQVRCFRNAATHLTDDGVFVIEVFVPDLTRFARGQNVEAQRVEADMVLLGVSRHDAVNQRVVSQHVHITESGTQLFPIQLRYAWPSELDLMARLAGMRLLDRWADWDRTPFTAASAKHVSVYQRA